MDPRLTMLQRLQDAVDAHDLDALVDCFDPDYRNETPAHPGRSFQGREQVRENWSRLFAGLSDLKATVSRTALGDADDVWSEWELRGTRPDGHVSAQRGVIVFGVHGGRAAWARFYLEPVDDGDGGVHAAVTRVVEAPAR